MWKHANRRLTQNFIISASHSDSANPSNSSYMLLFLSLLNVTVSKLYRVL